MSTFWVLPLIAACVSAVIAVIAVLYQVVIWVAKVVLCHIRNLRRIAEALEQLANISKEKK